MFNDRKDVDNILSALGEQLEQFAGELIELLVCGGSALNVVGLIQRTTKDVDVLAYINRTGTGNVLFIKADPLHPELIAAAKKVARDFNLTETWLNAGPASAVDFGLPDGLMARVLTRRYGQKLIVHFLGRYDQIYFKLYAVVDQGAGKHLDDLMALNPTAAELEKAARWSMTHDVSAGFKQGMKDVLTHTWDTGMSQKNFKNIFLEHILSFLWRQWSALGVLGESRSEDPWAVDPEPLLIFTLEMGRYEPRLFDEVMDWLVVNGPWIDLQRLRGILREKDETTKRLMGAAAAWLAKESNERKWKNIAGFCKPAADVDKDHAEALFFEKDGHPYPFPKNAEPVFLSCGFSREPLNPRRLTREVPVTSHLTIRFLLRALFGVGSRAECLIYLLTHDGGHPAEVAKAIGLSVRGTQDILINLSRSGLVLTRIKGKRKIEYWLSQERWWEFLSRGSLAEIKRPVWIDWIALFSALSRVWSALTEMGGEELSDYMRSSRLRDSLELVSAEFSRSGLDIPAIPGKDIKPQEYESAFESFIVQVFGAK